MTDDSEVAPGTDPTPPVPAPAPTPEPAPAPAPAARRVAPPPPVRLPQATPWISLLIALTIGATAVAFHQWGEQPFDETKLSSSVARDVLRWWKVVAALFVTGRDQVFPCLMTLGLVIRYGWRSERALGAGGTLLAFVLAGGVANLLRCALGLESDQLLGAAGGGVPGGVALIGVASAVSVRRREEGVFRSTFSGGLGAAFMALVFFPVSPNVLFVVQHDVPSAGGSEVKLILAAMQLQWPGVAAAFVLGGLLGSVLPLHDPERGRRARATLLAVSLALVALSSHRYVAALVPRIRGEVPPEAPTLLMTSDAELGIDFGMPLSFQRAEHSPESRGAGPRVLVLSPFYSNLPQIHLLVVPRDPGVVGHFDAKARAQELVQRFHREAEILDEGRLPGCALGDAYRVTARIVDRDRQLATYVYVVDVPGRQFVMQVFAEPDDATASVIADAVARSLKLRAGGADK